MTKWFGAATLVVALIASGSVTSRAAYAASAEVRKMQAQHAGSHGTRRLHLFSDHDAYWPSHDPRYYSRPYYYAPAPFVPLPPLFGYGWEPWW
jgi:hypothetical protein